MESTKPILNLGDKYDLEVLLNGGRRPWKRVKTITLITCILAVAAVGTLSYLWWAKQRGEHRKTAASRPGMGQIVGGIASEDRIDHFTPPPVSQDPVFPNLPAE